MRQLRGNHHFQQPFLHPFLWTPPLGPRQNLPGGQVPHQSFHSLPVGGLPEVPPGGPRTRKPSGACPARFAEPPVAQAQSANPSEPAEREATDPSSGQAHSPNPSEPAQRETPEPPSANPLEPPQGEAQQRSPGRSLAGVLGGSEARPRGRTRAACRTVERQGAGFGACPPQSKRRAVPGHSWPRPQLGAWPACFRKPPKRADCSRGSGSTAAQRNVGAGQSGRNAAWRSVGAGQSRRTAAWRSVGAGQSPGVGVWKTAVKIGIDLQD
eukprot:jgi/Botrbrau1/2540/Bobra.0079s0027.1